MNPLCAEQLSERRSLSGRMSCADGGLYERRSLSVPFVLRGQRTSGASPACQSPTAHLPRPPHSSRKASADISRSAGGLCSASVNMQKSSRWELFWPCGGDQNAQIHGRAYGQPKIKCILAHILRFKPACRPNHTIRKPFGLTLFREPLIKMRVLDGGWILRQMQENIS